MKKSRFISGMIATLAIAVLPGAQATMITYQLFDHPDGQLAGPDSPYGIRVDAFSRTFSVSSNGASVTLVWDTVANEATILGKVYDNVDSILRDVSYSMNNLGAPLVGDGFVVPQANPAPVLQIVPLDSFSIPAKPNDVGYIFEFIDDLHRLNNTGSHACSDGSTVDACSVPANTFVGRGWLGGEGYKGTNDFLVTAQVVPLPAALWLLISGIGALCGARRFSRRRVTT